MGTGTCHEPGGTSPHMPQGAEGSREHHCLGGGRAGGRSSAMKGAGTEPQDALTGDVPMGAHHEPQDVPQNSAPTRLTRGHQCSTLRWFLL